MAFAAQTGELPPITWLLMLATIFWVIAYDTAYAIVDKADDLKIGIKTSAITLGRFDVAGVMLCQMIFLSLMFWIGILQQLNVAYYIGRAMALWLVIYQYRLIHHREPASCFKAFLNNNRIGAVIFVGIAIDFLMTSNFTI
jgi:4-hydroxybenzoate polyprenyltransferase